MPYKDKNKMKEYMNRWGKLHPERLRANWLRKYQKNVEFMRTFKEKPCIDCGVEYPHYVMEFDHVRGIKKKGVAAMVIGGMKNLIKEIEKCDVICANCHRKREWKKREEYKNKDLLKLS